MQLNTTLHLFKLYLAVEIFEVEYIYIWEEKLKVEDFSRKWQKAGGRNSELVGKMFNPTFWATTIQLIIFYNLSDN